MLVIAVGPSYFNNNQQAWGCGVFGFYLLLAIDDWLWLILQADQAC